MSNLQRGLYDLTFLFLFLRILGLLCAVYLQGFLLSGPEKATAEPCVTPFDGLTPLRGEWDEYFLLFYSIGGKPR
jgi:hypothetical protein